MTHTPTPWTVAFATHIWSPVGKANIATVGEPRSPTNQYVGYEELRLSSPDFHEACANAEFIVQACNSYADLLAACKLLIGRLVALEPYLEFQSVQRVRNRDTVAVADAAIAKAEKGVP